MNLEPEKLLQSLAELKTNINAPDIIWTPELVNLPEDIIIYDLAKIFTDGPGNLIVIHSDKFPDYIEQRLLYIPKSGARFHFMECDTVKMMRKKGRGERHVFTSKTDGNFTIYNSDGTKAEEICLCAKIAYMLRIIRAITHYQRVVKRNLCKILTLVAPEPFFNFATIDICVIRKKVSHRLFKELLTLLEFYIILLFLIFDIT